MKDTKLILKRLIVEMITTRESKINQILTQIRAVKGVVTLSTQHTFPKGDDERSSRISIKYLATNTFNQDNMRELKKNILMIPGIKSCLIKVKKQNHVNIRTGMPVLDEPVENSTTR